MSIAETIGKKVALGTAIGVAGIMGFSKGIHGHNLSSDFYELATGNPDIDQGVFGTNVGMLEFLDPIGGAWNPNRITIAQKGGYLRGSGIPRLISGIRSGIINGTTLGDFAKDNNRPIADDDLRYASGPSGYNRDTRSYSSKPPMVDGSMVFGQYNSRFG